MKNEFKELDCVRIKSKNIIGYIVNITSAGTYDVEKEGLYGPVYWNVLEDDLEHIK